MSIEIERDPSRVVAEPGRTFSAEAVDTLTKELELWVGTRLVRSMENDHVPRRLVVRVHVEIDGRPAV